MFEEVSRERFRLLSDDELDPQARELLARLPPLNVIRAAAGAPSVLPALVEMAVALLRDTELPVPEREIAILRIAHRACSEYVWEQHERFSRLLGIDAGRITAVRDGGETDDDRLLCRAADEVSGGGLGASTRSELLERFGYRQTTELVLVLGWFLLITRLVASFDVAIEDAPAFGAELLDQ
jgi:alkylhydroperoxidase family enzyme